jgi:hypothetical protein
MTTDYKALCAELVATWKKGDDIVGAMNRARAALVEGAGVGVTDEELEECFYKATREYWDSPHESETNLRVMRLRGLRAVLARYGTHSRPIPVADTRYEFAVLDCEDEEQAGGSAATLADAIKEGNHYLALYSNDDGYGPYRLELREVRTLPAAAIPLPAQEGADG